MRCLFHLLAGLSLIISGLAEAPALISPNVLNRCLETGRRYVEGFNATDEELYPQHVPNAQAWSFLSTNIPLFECPNWDIQRTYYFRWWTYRKHIRSTASGFVITEFLPPVPWAGKENTISCAAGHHLYEGRWLHDTRYLDDYTRFWFRGGGEPRRYSFWAADAVYARYKVNLDRQLIVDLLPDLVANFRAWEKERRDPNGLFWQQDGQDGMEVSVGGSGYRATINSYMYGEARAIASMASIAGREDWVTEFRGKAQELKRLLRERLWDPEAVFFKVLPRREGAELADVRELHGLTPWYFDGLTVGLSDAPWKQLVDPQGFQAPFGPTTTEQRHPGFRVSYEGHECQWNGPSWPYSTAVTLTAMANLLHSGSAKAVTRADYLELLKTYARSHQRKRADGQVVPWIDENLDPLTGEWLARSRLEKWKDGTWDPGKGGRERGKDYNHSTFCDLVISGLVGIRPYGCGMLVVHPLVPKGAWDYFCLDQVKYHGAVVTVLYDKTGLRYGQGPGLKVFINGKLAASAPGLEKTLMAELPPQTAPRESAGRWKKSSANPLLGGELGTCFDVSVLKEASKYRMWFSWRPKKSVALVESSDGVHWTEPQIVLEPNGQTDWETDVNRPVVLKRGDTYHMWYTGQAKKRSKIGFRDVNSAQIGLARSRDGISGWERHPANPIIRTGAGSWDADAVYKPYAVLEADRWLLWYNGRRGNTEQIGLAEHAGADLGF